MRLSLLLALLLFPAACRPQPAGSPRGEDELGSTPHRLPTGTTLDPAGRTVTVGQFPLAAIPSPEGNRLVLLLNGYRDQGMQVVEAGTWRVTQTLELPAAFIGLGFDHAGRRLYASGGNQDVVYRYDWHDGSATLRDSLVLAPKQPRRDGTRYPAGLALAPDDRLLYVAENLADTLAVVDVATGQVVQRLPAGRYPYAVVTGPDGTVYASAWGGSEVRIWKPADGRLQPAGSVPVGRHPSALLLSHDGSKLFVASASTDRVSVVDARSQRVTLELVDTVPGGTGEGSTPNALTLSADERRLYVAEADNNAVAVFDLADGGRLAGRIPVEWYPTALAILGDALVVANGKGRSTGPNKVGGPGPGRRGPVPGYTLNQLTGSLSVLAFADLGAAALPALSSRVARANGWDRRLGRPSYPPFEHVIYIIKENRTYDQVLGDLREGDGDTSLVFFPRAVSPNHHALAERFGIFDRFMVNAEVSAQGHNWSTAAYSSDYVEKTVQQNYSSRGRSYDFEGTNRGVRPAAGEDAAEPANGYLWDLAKRRNISFRNFGEFVTGVRGSGPVPAGYVGLKPFLEANTDSTFPGFDLDIPDRDRAALWLKALAGWQREGRMPALQIVRLPNDHTAGAREGKLTPRALMADNDLALGQLIEGLSRSSFWNNTVVFVVEDDAQNGPDHVDSHRAPFLVISAWNQPRVWHRFTNTTDVFATIEELLTLQPLSQFDAFGRPLRGIFAGAPDPTPYVALTPGWSLTERNPPPSPGREAASRRDLRFEDLGDDEAFNRELWLAIKGSSVPYPGTTVLTPMAWAKRKAEPR